MVVKSWKVLRVSTGALLLSSVTCLFVPIEPTKIILTLDCCCCKHIYAYTAHWIIALLIFSFVRVLIFSLKYS